MPRVFRRHSPDHGVNHQAFTAGGAKGWPSCALRTENQDGLSMTYLLAGIELWRGSDGNMMGHTEMIRLSRHMSFLRWRAATVCSTICRVDGRLGSYRRSIPRRCQSCCIDRNGLALRIGKATKRVHFVRSAMEMSLAKCWHGLCHGPASLRPTGMSFQRRRAR